MRECEIQYRSCLLDFGRNKSKNLLFAAFPQLPSKWRIQKINATIRIQCGRSIQRRKYHAVVLENTTALRPLKPGPCRCNFLERQMEVTAVQVLEATKSVPLLSYWMIPKQLDRPLRLDSCGNTYFWVAHFEGSYGEVAKTPAFLRSFRPKTKRQERFGAMR